MYSINEDKYGNLWLTTEESLIKLAFSNGVPELTAYSDEDGIGEALFTPNSTFRHGNELYFGTSGGFMAFTPRGKSQRSSQQGSYKIVVTDIMIGDKAYTALDSTMRQRISAYMPEYTKEIVIPPSVDKFGVEFALLAYSNPAHNKYAYKLEGYNNKWQYRDATDRKATFENLPSGTYHLRLKAADNYGYWQEMPYTITVKVLPPWYASWWMFIVYLLFIATAIYLGINWYKEHLKTKNRLQMAVIYTNIAHELLTPLTVISASIDNLRAKAPQFSHDYDTMQGNIHWLTRLLRQILEIRKAQAGRLKLLVAKGNLAEFITDKCDSMAPLLTKKNITLNTDIQPIEGFFDPDKMDKVIYNLLSNATKYTKEGGRIEVALRQEDGKAIITVADNGIGISKEKQKNLYYRFLDGDYRKMGTMGTGIGLSLTRDLVVLHHGNIDCRSEEGHGTTFTVTIPIEATAYKEEETDHTEQAPYKEADRKQIEMTEVVEPATTVEKQPGEKTHSLLIVEDNPELLNLMYNLLSRKYNVFKANNGKKALGVIAKEEIDMVISDVMMPVMDGIELTKQIKGNKDLAQLPVVLLTARTANEQRNEAYTVGADEYITKPFSMDDLLLRIDNIIDNRERIRQKFSRSTDFNVEEQHYNSPDETFIQKAIDCVKTNIKDSEYDRERFASDMCVSSSTLYNKLRALTGQNITGFINSIRLKEACAIARAKPTIQVGELSVMVGFNSPKYFSKCFKKEFGMLLKDYVARLDEVS